MAAAVSLLLFPQHHLHRIMCTKAVIGSARFKGIKKYIVSPIYGRSDKEFLNIFNPSHIKIFDPTLSFP